ACDRRLVGHRADQTRGPARLDPPPGDTGHESRGSAGDALSARKRHTLCVRGLVERSAAGRRPATRGRGSAVARHVRVARGLAARQGMTQLLAIIVAAFLSAIATPAMAADPAPQPQSPQPDAQAQPAGAPVSPLAAQAFDRLSATRDRPLFSPTRRPPAPPPVVEAAPPPPPPPPNIVLLAVVMDG